MDIGPQIRKEPDIRTTHHPPNAEIVISSGNPTPRPGWAVTAGARRRFKHRKRYTARVWATRRKDCAPRRIFAHRPIPAVSRRLTNIANGNNSTLPRTASNPNQTDMCRTTLNQIAGGNPRWLASRKRTHYVAAVGHIRSVGGCRTRNFSARLVLPRRHDGGGNARKG